MKSLLKRIAFLVVLLALLAGCSAPPAASAPGEKIKVGFNPDLPPLASLDSKNAPAGLEIDLIKAVLDQARLPYELINVGFNTNTLLDTCQIDLGIGAIPISEALKGQMLLSEPYYTTGHSVVVKKGNLAVTGRNALAGATVGTQTASISEPEIGKIQGAKSKPYATFSLAFLDLANGYIDAVIADTPRALNYVAIKRYNLKVAGPAFGSVQYGIGVCKKDQDLLTQVNGSLAKLKADGQLDKIITKWASP